VTVPTSYPALELAVIRLAESSGEIPHSSPLDHIARAHMTLGALSYYTANDRVAEAKKMAGHVIRSLILYAAIQDIDLKECLAMAYEAAKEEA
jgi:hypothetical protein